ncbi:hypothetical protein KPL76_14460 [Subtercola sp. PAMC28395]|uniref:protealysin inhibitor emfourin n=1 Tax=Subtercola sp. PAMC28395 TaxID=2846775 RepID=UPI001C0C3B51|nr:protealysin inhibitor emfourin [Subtercola sp. PAMC28395]QWT23852.1 hypothetical protein KPL76_14460 [Subtercola sp. PAMC28395]
MSVARSGGFAGLNRIWTAEASGDADVGAWCTLLDECSWESDPGTHSTDPPVGSIPVDESTAPDRFTYRISVSTSTDDGAQPERRAVVAESDLTDSWRELIDRVKSATSQ